MYQLIVQLLFSTYIVYFKTIVLVIYKKLIKYKHLSDTLPLNIPISIEALERSVKLSYFTNHLLHVASIQVLLPR